MGIRWDMGQMRAERGQEDTQTGGKRALGPGGAGHGGYGERLTGRRKRGRQTPCEFQTQWCGRGQTSDMNDWQRGNAGGGAA